MLTSCSGESPIGGGDQPVRAMSLSHGCRQATADNLLFTPFKRPQSTYASGRTDSASGLFCQPARRCGLEMLIKKVCAADAKDEQPHVKGFLLVRQTTGKQSKVSTANSNK